MARKAQKRAAVKRTPVRGRTSKKARTPMMTVERLAEATGFAVNDLEQELDGLTTRVEDAETELARMDDRMHYGVVLGNAVMGLIVAGLTDAVEIAARSHEIASATLAWTPAVDGAVIDADLFIDIESDDAEPETSISDRG